MPIQATETAWNDHAIRSRSLAITAMAKNNLAFGILLSEVVRRFFPASFIVPVEWSALFHCIKVNVGSLLRLRWDNLLILSICTSLDIHKVLTNRFGQTEGSWVLILELRDQRAPHTARVIIEGTILLELA